MQQPETLISQMKDSTTRSEQLSHDDSRYKSNVTQSSGTITPKMFETWLRGYKMFEY
jgi:hypothetical protein